MGPSTTTPPRVSSHLSTTASARLRLMLKPMPGDTDTPPLSTDMDPVSTDTHMADTDTTTARGPLKLSPQLMLRLMLTTDTLDTPVSTTPLSTDTDLVSTDTDTHLPDTDTTTARGPLMPSPKLRLRPMLTTDTPDTPVSTTPLSTDTDPASTDMDTDTPMAPDTLTMDRK